MDCEESSLEACLIRARMGPCRATADRFGNGVGCFHERRNLPAAHRTTLKKIDTVFLDAGGVLVWPNWTRMFARSSRAAPVLRPRDDSLPFRPFGPLKPLLQVVVPAAVVDHAPSGLLDEALTRLATLNPRQARVVELRYFGGLSVEQIGLMLGIAPRSVKRDWSLARIWLFRELRPEVQG